MADTSRAVFLSYASEDADAAHRVCGALREAGIEVWFDKNELRGGDAWDRSIRQQIRECRLFVPIVSAHTDARREGYFRREWKLAVDRTHDMSERAAFLVPVVIDDTNDSRADVPDRFREVQWTHLPAGGTPPAFVERLRRLLSREPPLCRQEIPVPATAAAARAGAQSQTEAERRQVTVLFAQLAQSAPRATGIDPEDVREIVAAYRRCVAEVVGRYDGHVAQFFGEGILVYFGYPTAHEDDPERAVSAGLESIARVAGLEVGGAPIQARVGIATGLVVVGDSMDSSPQGGIVGKTPELAVRLLEVAEPGTVIVAESTRRLVGDLFELVDLGTVGLKGIETPVHAWRALGTGSAEGRFEALHAAGLTPLVGRQEEIDLLVRRWGTASSGEGQVVLLSGEPGIGKSRLAIALMEHLAGQPFACSRYFCSPQHGGTAFHPFITQLKRAAGIRPGEPVETRSNKLYALLAQSTTSALDIRVFCAMLSVPAAEDDSTPGPTPEQLRQQILKAIVAQTEALVAQTAALIVFEDAHWSDPTSLEVLSLIVDRISKLRALLIITFRPEFEPPWAGESHVTTLSLQRLTERHAAALIDRIEDGKKLPDQVRRNIIERTDGIPLFVEEMTKAVLEGQHEGQARHSAASAAVPETLQASLMARLDRLGSAKEVAQVGAALGREFSHALLVAVAEMQGAELDSALERLFVSGLMFRRGVHPYRTYIFKHALVQDTAYSTLLREPRRVLHARIARVLESRFSELVDGQPELLARHYTAAGEIEKAAVFWAKAGQRSLARSALVEAIEQLAQAIDQMEALPGNAARRGEQIKLRVALVNTLFHVKGYAAPETRAAVEQAQLLLEQIGARGETLEDPLLPFSVLWGLWVASLVAFDSTPCCELAKRFLSLAEKQSVTGLHVVGHQILGISLLTAGEIAQGRAHYDRGISLYDASAHRMLATRFAQDSRVVMLSRRAAALWLLGYPAAALADAELALTHARDTAREIGHAATLMYALSHVGFAHCQRGNYATAVATLDECIALAEEKGALYWKEFSLLNRGSVCAAAGQPADAVRIINSGFEVRKSTGTTMWSPLFLSQLAYAHAQLGQPADALNAIGKAIQVLETAKEGWCEAEVRRLAGEVALLLPERDSVRAEACFKLALVAARAQQAKAWELRAATSLAKLWLEQGNHSAARDLLAPVYAWFTEGEDTLDLKRAKALLDGMAPACELRF